MKLHKEYVCKDCQTTEAKGEHFCFDCSKNALKNPKITCEKCINTAKQKPAKFSVFNKMYIGNRPEIARQITYIEEMAVSLAAPYIHGVHTLRK